MYDEWELMCFHSYIYICIYTYIIYCIIVSILIWFYMYILYTHYTCIHTIRQANLMVFLVFLNSFPAVVFLQIAIVWWMFGCCFFVAPLNWWGKKYRTELRWGNGEISRNWPYLSQNWGAVFVLWILYVPGSKLPLFPYYRGWSSTQ